MRSVIKNFRNIKYGPAPEDDKEVLQWIKTLPNPNYNFISGEWIKPRETKTIQAINPANKNKLFKLSVSSNLMLIKLLNLQKKLFPYGQKHHPIRDLNIFMRWPV